MTVQRGDGGERGDGTVGKALGVLEQVSEAGRPVRFSDLLAASPHPKATLYRLLQTLTSQGMLDHDAATGTYRPGLRLMRLAHAAWATTSLAPVAGPYLDALSRDVGETVHLAQLDGASVLYVDKRNAARAVPMYAEAGKVGPAYCTGVGKAMLAHLPPEALEAALSQQSWHRFTDATLTDPGAMRAELAAIRAEGVARDREEHEPGIHCIAMPIHGPTGLVGALSVTASRARRPSLEDAIPRLRAARDGIQADLGHRPALAS